VQEPTDPQPAKHDPRTCHLCATGRHPSRATQGRQLQAHLAAHPFPRQTAGAQR
jgi:hypothetical protein